MNGRTAAHVESRAKQAQACRVTLMTTPGQSLCDALGLPPETRLIDTPICSAMTIKRGRRWLGLSA